MTALANGQRAQELSVAMISVEAGDYAAIAERLTVCFVACDCFVIVFVADTMQQCTRQVVDGIIDRVRQGHNVLITPDDREILRVKIFRMLVRWLSDTPQCRCNCSVCSHGHNPWRVPLTEDDRALEYHIDRVSLLIVRNLHNGCPVCEGYLNTLGDHNDGTECHTWAELLLR